MKLRTLVNNASIGSSIVSNITYECKVLKIGETEGGTWELSVLFAHSFCKPKTVLKIKSVKKKKLAEASLVLEIRTCSKTERGDVIRMQQPI